MKVHQVTEIVNMSAAGILQCVVLGVDRFQSEICSIDEDLRFPV